MAPPKPKSKQQAMPSMLKSMQRSVTVASAAVDNAFASSSTGGGVGQRSSVAAAQERHSLLANDGMMSDHHPASQVSSPDRVGGIGMGDLPGTGVGAGAPKAPKLMKMSSRHIKMKKMMDNITTRLKLHSRGDNIAFGRRDRGDASGKSYNVEIPKNMIVLILIGFFLAPLAFGLYVLFRQLFMSDEVHSRYQHHSSGSGGKHPAAYHITKDGDFSNATVASTALNATIADGIDNVLEGEGEEEESASIELPPEVASEAKDTSTTTVGDREDADAETNDLAAGTVGATANENTDAVEDKESTQTDDAEDADAVSNSEKGAGLQKDADANDADTSEVAKGNADDTEGVGVIDDTGDEKEANAKEEDADDEQESIADKDESDEDADSNGESLRVVGDADTRTAQKDEKKATGDVQESKEEEKASSDENADTESIGTERMNEKGDI